MFLTRSEYRNTYAYFFNEVLKTLLQVDLKTKIMSMPSQIQVKLRAADTNREYSSLYLHTECSVAKMITSSLSNVSKTMGMKKYDVPGKHEFTVPAGVRQVMVELYSAGGISKSKSIGGDGGTYIKDILTVQPEKTIDVVVGHTNDPRTSFDQLTATLDGAINASESALIVKGEPADNQTGHGGRAGGFGGAGGQMNAAGLNPGGGAGAGSLKAGDGCVLITYMC
jgi:hypothetical protein